MDNKIQPVKEAIIEAIRTENLITDNYIIPDPINRSLRTLMSMTSDLNFALKALEKLIYLTSESAENTIEKTSLWKSCIVTYSKCFTEGRKAGHFNLDSKEVYKDNIKLKSIHDEVLRIRNDFISHRGDNEYEYVILFYSQTKHEAHNPTVGRFNMKSLRATNLTVDELQEYKNLFSILENYLDNRRHIQGKKLHKLLIEKYKNEIVKWKI